MTEITSYAELFVEAKRLGLLLNNFCQIENGNFQANWRRGGKFFDCAEHPLPFVALLNAFVLADLTTPRESRQSATAEDLFA